MRLKFCEILEDIFLIREDSDKFTFNSYLINIPYRSSYHSILVDPLPYKYFEEFKDILLKITGNNSVDFVFLSHGAPDVISSIEEIVKLFSDITIIASNGLWKYLRIYGIKEEQFQPIEFIPNKKLKMDEWEISFVHIPFCTYPFSYALYHHNRNVLFTGNLLSGFVSKKNEGIFAEEDSFLGIKIFHEYYIPSNFILRSALDRICRLEKIPEMIFPRHGDIIKKEFLEEIYSKLNNLEVGIEYITRIEREEERYLYALRDIIKKSQVTLGHKYILSKIQKLNVSSSFYSEFFKIEGGIITEVRINPSSALELIINALMEDLEEEERKEFMKSSIDILREYNLEIPESLREDYEISPLVDRFINVLSMFKRKEK